MNFNLSFFFYFFNIILRSFLVGGLDPKFLMVLWFCRDDQIIFNGNIFYITYFTLPRATHMPFWRADGVVITIPLHMGPTEFLYYLFLRALHHQYLYSRYHYHHHSSIVTEPITCKN